MAGLLSLALGGVEHFRPDKTFISLPIVAILQCDILPMKLFSIEDHVLSVTDAITAPFTVLTVVVVLA